MASAELRAGTPVPVDPLRIERELAALWKPASEARGGEDAVVRACLSNLVVFAPSGADMARAQDVLQEVFARHPNRAIILELVPPDAAPEAPLEASLSTVCSFLSFKSAPVCCEQIRLRTSAHTADLFLGAVPPLLVPDIPVVLWWTSDDCLDLLPRMGAFADRVIVDSRHCRAGGKVLRRLLDLLSPGGLRELVDLAWRGLDGWRHAVADVFDEESMRALLPELRVIEVTALPAAHGSGAGLGGAALLAGWIGSRLSWSCESAAREPDGSVTARMQRADGGVGRIELRHCTRSGRPAPGAPCELRLRAGDSGSDAFVAVVLDDAGESARIDFRTPSLCRLPRAVPFPKLTDARLVGEILDRPPHPRIFREALELAVEILGH
jgi:glucose-6-phosphate dehydrogenase assembly protein OpcA